MPDDEDRDDQEDQSQDEDQEDQDDQSQDDSGDGHDDDGDDQEEPTPAAFARQIIDQIGDNVGSLIDSRITSLMNTLRRDYGIEKKGRQRQQSKDDDKHDPMRERFVKAAVVEELGLETFADKEELKAARKIAFGLVEGRTFDDGDDDYEIAEQIVTQVRESLDTLKKTYQTQLRRDLKRRGTLRDEEDDTKPPASRKRSKSDPQKQFDAGAQLARTRLADRFEKQGE